MADEEREIFEEDKDSDLALYKEEGAWYVRWDGQAVFVCDDSTAATELFQFLKKLGDRLSIKMEPEEREK